MIGCNVYNLELYYEIMEFIQILFNLDEFGIILLNMEFIQNLFNLDNAVIYQFILNLF